LVGHNAPNEWLRGIHTCFCGYPGRIWSTSKCVSYLRFRSQPSLR